MNILTDGEKLDLLVKKVEGLGDPPAPLHGTVLKGILLVAANMISFKTKEDFDASFMIADEMTKAVIDNVFKDIYGHRDERALKEHREIRERAGIESQGQGEKVSFADPISSEAVAYLKDRLRNINCIDLETGEDLRHSENDIV